MRNTAYYLAFTVLALCIRFGESITVADLYTRLLEKNRKVEDTFAFQFVKPIGVVAGEYIWPRSYSTSSEITFDENGAAFNVHPRPTLSRILQSTRSSSLRQGNSAYADYYRRRR